MPVGNSSSRYSLSDFQLPILNSKFPIDRLNLKSAIGRDIALRCPAFDARTAQRAIPTRTKLWQR